VDRPRKPRRNASNGEWERYHSDLAYWQSQQRGQRLGQFAKEQTYQFGTGTQDSTRVHSAPVHGTTERGELVTVAFGYDNTSREGYTFIADGYVDNAETFWGEKLNKLHDDYDGRGGGTQRNKFTGYGS
jgi:hypothetical protein